MTREINLDRGGQIVEGTAILLAAGFDDREHGLNEATATGALCAERKLAPDHRVSQRALAGVLGRLDLFVTDQRPQPVAMRVDF